jgi:replicative DNA helicase
MIDNADTLATYPHALGAEKSVLSVLLREPQMLDELPGIASAHFHIAAHRELFEIIREMTLAGQAVELVSLVQTLHDRGKLDRMGGPAFLAEINGYQPTDHHLQAHTAILSEKLARRMTIAAAAEMHRVALEAEDMAEIIEATSAPISALHDALTGTRPAPSTRAVIHGCLERFHHLCTGQADPMGIETSLVEINRRFRGLHPKQTVVISGYPGGGKTTLAGQLAMDAALSGANTRILSLEMPSEAMMNRLLAYVGKLPGDCITDPLRYARDVLGKDSLTKQVLEAVKDAAKKITASPLAIEDMIGANVHQITACIRRAHRKTPLAVVVVDFVQRIRAVPEMRRESREQQLAHASNHLADLSKELGFCLLLPSQLNKEGAAKHAEAINEDADLHLQIVQDRSGTAPTFAHQGIAVVKDRHCGQDGTLLPIVLEGSYLRFIPKLF